LASITLDNVTVDFPVYGSQRSFRKQLLAAATGGRIRHEGHGGKRVTVRALDKISLQIEHGDRLALIGHNGAGKSTLLRVIAGVYAPTEGRITVEGTLSPLFTASPGIDMDSTGYENLVTCGMFLGMSRAEIAAKTREIEEVCELGEYLNLPMRTYSSGMMTRFGFALATSIDPGILLLDEGISAGDARFAERATKRVEQLVGRSHILVFASHSIGLIQSLCNKAVLLAKGRLVGAGSVPEVVKAYKDYAPTTPGAELLGQEGLVAAE
jgi:ABC-type polysaccharide/polyol phosphate transport system ATPase subunit